MWSINGTSLVVCHSFPFLQATNSFDVLSFRMWFETNTGNGNYVFFQSLGYNVFVCIILAEFCSASLQRDKALRLATKERGALAADNEKGN